MRTVTRTSKWVVDKSITMSDSFYYILTVIQGCIAQCSCIKIDQKLNKINKLVEDIHN